MEKLTFENKVTLKEAYLIMYEYLDKHWEETGKPDDIGALLSELSLWNTANGKQPMDNSIFPKWINCANTVLEQEKTSEGYKGADINLSK